MTMWSSVKSSLSWKTHRAKKKSKSGSVLGVEYDSLDVAVVSYPLRERRRAKRSWRSSRKLTVEQHETDDGRWQDVPENTEDCGIFPLGEQKPETEYEVEYVPVPQPSEPSYLQVSQPPPSSTKASTASQNVVKLTCHSIIALHGLGGHWKNTWTDTNGKFWLRDYLPEKLINARVLSWGYNSYKAFTRGEAELEEAAKELLDGIEEARTDKTRPVVVIAHSLGGVLAKRVRHLCSGFS
jgi:pimeloyl-ACP methyl ester carboxylesterase